MTDPVRITNKDLADPRIDKILADQQGFGFASDPQSDVKQPLIFKPWFALMIAGALGALLAWAVIEPGFDDGLRFTTSIDGVHAPASPMEGMTNVVLELQGRNVVIFRDSRIMLPNGSRGTVEDLSQGDPIEVLAEPLGDTAMIARTIRQLPAGTSVPPRIDFESLASSHTLFGFLMFPLTAAFIGLFIGSTDGCLSRAWARALTSGAVGMGTGFLAGCVAAMVAGLIYQLGEGFVQSSWGTNPLSPSGKGLLLSMMRRGLAWAVVGIAGGIGQGVAMRSRKLVVNGLIGGMMGSLLGGLLFDPLDIFFNHIFTSGGAELSRMVGLACVGAGAGLMIGLVELVARESWVKMITGPIAGKEFVLYRNPTWIGSSPKSEIYLFKDPQVAPQHAAIHRVGEHYEIEDQGSTTGTVVGGQRLKRRRLRDHERVTIGQTILEFRMRDE